MALDFKFIVAYFDHDILACFHYSKNPSSLYFFSAVRSVDEILKCDHSNHSYLRGWLGNLAMKTTVLQFMLEGPRPCTILCFNVHTTVEYLNKNASIGLLLQHIPNSIVVCAGSRPKRQTKTYNKEVCQVS